MMGLIREVVMKWVIELRASLTRARHQDTSRAADAVGSHVFGSVCQGENGISPNGSRC
jgi:hypothetical protein